MKRNLLHYFSYNTVNLAVGILAVPVLTRLLGPTEYGASGVAISVLSTLQTCCFQWLQVAVSRFYGTPMLKGSQLELNHVWIPLLASIVAAEIGFASMLGSGAVELAPSLAFITSAALLTQGVFVVLMERLYMLQRGSKYQLAGNSFTVFRNLVGLCLALLVAREAWTLLLGWVIVQGLLLIVMLIDISPSELSPRLPSKGQFVQIVSYSGPIAIANLLGTSLLWLPVYMLSKTHGTAEVALFQVTTTIAGLLVFFIPNIVLFEAYPRLQAAYSRGETVWIAKTLFGNLALTLAVGCGAVIVTFFCGSLLLRTIAGPAYFLPSAGVALAACGILFQAAGRSLDPIYKLELTGWRLAFIFGASSIVGAVASGIAVPRYGAMGGFLGMTFGYLTALCIFVADAVRFAKSLAAETTAILPG